MSTTGLTRAARWAAVIVGTLVLILGPFLLFEQSFTASVLTLLHAEWPRPLIALLVVALLATDVLLPVPSSVVASLAGRFLGFTNGLLAVWAGMMLGCLAGYGIGRFGGSRVIRSVLGDSELARARFVVARFGLYGLVVSRSIPVLAEATALFAGVTGYRFGRFVLATGLANLGIAAVYGAIGAHSDTANSFLSAFAGAIAVPAAGLWVASLMDRHRRLRSWTRDAAGR